MTRQADWSLDDPFLIDIAVGEADVDELGHANNAAYVVWCERVAWAHTESLGLGLSEYRQQRRAMVVHKSRFEYLAPAFTGDELLAATWIVGCDGLLRVQRRFEIVRVSDGRRLLRGGIDYVCVDMDSFRARRMPPAFVEGYAGAVVSGGSD